MQFSSYENANELQNSGQRKICQFDIAFSLSYHRETNEFLRQRITRKKFQVLSGIRFSKVWRKGMSCRV